MIDLHGDFNHSHNGCKQYLALPVEYLRDAGGARWSDSIAGLLIDDADEFVYYEEIAKFLEGFTSRRSLVPFAEIILWLKKLALPHEPGDQTGRLRQAFVRSDAPWRNAGALAGELCDGFEDSVSAPAAEVVCDRLRDTAFPILWFAGLLNGRAITGEEPTMTATAFEVHVDAALSRLTDDELTSWLKFGRGGVRRAGEELVQEPPPPQTWSDIVEQMSRRPRLHGLAEHAERIVAGLSVPPRRKAPQQLPLGGYADVVTRGHIEQLLPSQHAVDELEFLRRYSEGELLFFRREEPPSQNRTETAIALDQGVRTWGDVRLVLAAAVVALVGRSERKSSDVVRVSLAATSRAGFVEPRTMTADDLGAIIEASDLSRDPGMALERILDDAAELPRDIYLLTHPFALAEENVRAAARRLRPRDRLFALTLNGHGAAELSELRHGDPVRLKSFRVDFTPATTPAAKPRPSPATVDERRWTGDVEPTLYPFAYPIDGPIAHFDFDAAAKRILVVYGSGMIATWDLTTQRMEIVPRPMIGGLIARRWVSLIGTYDGFALLGEIDVNGGLVVHYDFRARSCAAIPIQSPSPAARLEPHRGHDTLAVVDDDNWLFGVVQLRSRRWTKMEKLRTTRCLTGRALSKASSAASPERGHYYLVNSTGKILVSDGNMNCVGWQEFTPQTGGKPTFGKQRGIGEAQVAGSVVSLVTTATDGVMQRLWIDLFRGPAGDFIRQIVAKSSSKSSPLHRLSFDGDKIAFGSRDRIEVQTTDAARRLLMTSGGNASHRAPQLWIGDRAFLLSVGRQGYSWHLVDWKASLLVRTEKARTTTPVPRAFKLDPIRRFADAHSKDAKLGETRIIEPRSGIEFQVRLDQHGQVEIRVEGETVFRFYARGESWTAWLPDGTRLGRGNVHVWPDSPDAAAKMGKALRSSIERGGP